MHDEVVYRRVARGPKVLGPGSALRIEDGRHVANLDAWLVANRDDRMACRNRGDDWIQRAADAHASACCGAPRQAVRVADGQRREPDRPLGAVRSLVSGAV